MAHIYKYGTKIFKIGTKAFTIKDNFTFLNTPHSFTSPGGIDFDPIIANNRFFLCSNNTVLVVNATTFAVIATITGFSTTQNICYDSANNRLFVTDSGSNSVKVVDTGSYTIIATITDSFAAPCGVCIDSSNRLFVACFSDGTVHVLNATTFAPITIITGLSQAISVRLDKITANNRLFVLKNGIGFSTIDLTTLGIVGSYTTLKGYDMQQDPLLANDRILDVNGAVVDFVNTGTFGLLQTLGGFNSLRSVSFDPNQANNRILITDYNANKVVEITQVLS